MHLILNYSVVEQPLMAEHFVLPDACMLPVFQRQASVVSLHARPRGALGTDARHVAPSTEADLPAVSTDFMNAGYGRRSTS
jgi:hypothetical protein